MPDTFRRHVPLWLTLIAAVLFVGAVLLWWFGVYQSPRYVFQDMLANNLEVTAVTKNELHTASDQNVLQRVNLQLGGTNASRWFVTIQQSKSSVSTDSIGTKDGGYVRYTEILDDGGRADRYKSAVGVWAKGSPGDGTTLNTLFEQSLLDMTAVPVLPLGAVRPEVRGTMLNYINTEGVFAVDYGKVGTTTINGRKALTYEVAVNIAPYLRLMQFFAQNYGLKSLDQVSPSDYQDTAPVKLRISVDKLSHQMLRAESADGKFSETYSDYGIQRDIPIPQHTIPVKQLQQKLQGLSG